MPTNIGGLSPGLSAEQRTRHGRDDVAGSAGVPSEGSGSTSSKGDVTLSSDASKIKSLESKLSAASEIDLGRVEKIKAQLANGEYHIDPARVAAKFLQLEEQL